MSRVHGQIPNTIDVVIHIVLVYPSLLGATLKGKNLERD